MDANNRISTLVNSQVPFFVRNDHQNFVKFLEAYYEWMERPDDGISYLELSCNGPNNCIVTSQSFVANTTQYNVVTRAKNILSYQDIDRTIDEFSDDLYNTFLKLIPKDTVADKAIILKNVKDFYRSRGTEKSIRFLMRILFGNENIEFYYPKKDILRASDGKWFIEKSLKFGDVLLGGNVTTDIVNIQKFVGLKITGNNSGATASVERVDSYYEGSAFVREFKISNQTKDFFSGEQVFATYTENGTTQSLVANTFSGIVNTVRITNPGSGYSVGNTITVESNTGSGAIIRVDAVTTGNIRSLFVLNGGAGFRSNDQITIADTTGSGARANVFSVNTDESFHPNTYNIVISLISTEANTAIGNTKYSNLNSSITDPANNWIINSMSIFAYSNTGPVDETLILASGINYSSNPSFATQANTRVRTLGILGRMEIINGGSGYQIGDVIEFINRPGNYGYGARANVLTVNGTGAITNVRFTEIPGHLVGGAGYIDSITLTPEYPIANVISSNVQASGANIAVTALLGEGASYRAFSSTLGQITRLSIISGGSGYETAPTLNLSSIGDGTAQAVATIVTGTYSYPGRWLNDDGHLSSYNFLQNRDYYQIFSYVVKVSESIQKYRKALKDLIHPAGMKLFGEYLSVDDDSPIANAMRFRGSNTRQFIEYSNRPYQIANLNANVTPGIRISMNTAGLSQNSEVYIGFNTGNVASYNANGIYYVSNVINSNAVLVYSGTKIPVSMNIANREITSTGITFGDNGRIMYIVGENSDSVLMYDLQYPWDISSATYRTQSPILDDSSPRGVVLSSNGKFMYVSGFTAQTVFQYSLTNPWNVGSMSLLTTLPVGSQDTIPNDLYVGDNGTKLYIIGNTNDRVFQYNLTEAWNVNSAIYTSNVSILAQDGNPTGIYFKDDGTMMYIVGTVNDRIYQYDLSEAWNVQTAIYRSNTISFTSIEGTPRSVTFSKRGDIVYFVGITNDILVQAPLSEEWNVSTMVLDRFDTVAANSGNVTVTKNIF